VPGKRGAEAAAAPQGPSFSTSFPSLGEFACGLPASWMEKVFRGRAHGSITGRKAIKGLPICFLFQS
jgi:hypothetical protein